MDNKEISPRESLLLIENMIGEAKKQFSENGHLYLIWGWAILACSLSQFILRYFFHYPYFYAVWFITWPIVIYQIWYLAKIKRRKKVRTYADRVIGYVWLTFIILAILISNLIPNNVNQYTTLVPIVLALYGMPTFLSGIILRFNALVAGGICCWILSVATVFIPKDFQDLSVCAAMVVAWIIPGYLLKARFSSQKS